MDNVTTLRIDKDLKEKIRKEAEEQGRSQHNLMIWILNKYFADKEKN